QWTRRLPSEPKTHAGYPASASLCHWMSRSRSGLTLHLLERVDGSIRVDEIVPVQNDGRLVIVRVQPHVVARILAQKPPELLKELSEVLRNRRRTKDEGRLRTRNGPRTPEPRTTDLGSNRSCTGLTRKPR